MKPIKNMIIEKGTPLHEYLLQLKPYKIGYCEVLKNDELCGYSTEYYFKDNDGYTLQEKKRRERG